MIRWQSCVPTHSPTMEPVADKLAGATSPVADGEAETGAGVAEDGADGATVGAGEPEHAVVSNTPSTTTSTPRRVRPWPRVVIGRS